MGGPGLEREDGRHTMIKSGGIRENCKDFSKSMPKKDVVRLLPNPRIGPKDNRRNHMTGEGRAVTSLATEGIRGDELDLCLENTVSQ
jgi:hypothetical protein